MPEMGLRERKKQATRAALIEAARRLGAERDAKNVRLEDIAVAAGVAPRTVGNYFASKDEIILAIGAARAERISQALLDRPAGESLWEALGNVLLAEFTDAKEVTRANVAAAQATLEQSVAQLQMQRSIEPKLAAAIAERTGTDPGRDLYPRLVAGAVVAVNRITIDYWRESADPALSLPDLLHQTLWQLAEGLPVPEEGSG
jgi:AcrR family transcriptional regulator